MSNKRDDGDRQEREWNALYQALRTPLGGLGVENPRGDGDFWIVDDNGGSFQHKLCVTRVSWLTPDIVRAIAALLADGHPGWEVLLSLDPHGVEERWDRARLRRQFGGDSKF